MEELCRLLVSKAGDLVEDVAKLTELGTQLHDSFWGENTLQVYEKYQLLLASDRSTWAQLLRHESPNDHFERLKALSPFKEDVLHYGWADKGKPIVRDWQWEALCKRVHVQHDALPEHGPFLIIEKPDGSGELLAA